MAINSPFAAALVEHLPKPGLDLRRAFGFVRDEVLKNTGNKQEPYVYGSLGGDDVPLVPAKPVATGPQADPQAAVRRDYELALQVGDRDAWEAFLQTYPEGFYANLAKVQLKKIAAEEARATAAEKARLAEQEKFRLAAERAKQAEQVRAAAAAKAAEEARIAAEKAKQIEQEKATAAEKARLAQQEKARLAAEKAKHRKRPVLPSRRVPLRRRLRPKRKNSLRRCPHRLKRPSNRSRPISRGPCRRSFVVSAAAPGRLTATGTRPRRKRSTCSTSIQALSSKRRPRVRTRSMRSKPRQGGFVRWFASSVIGPMAIAASRSPVGAAMNWATMGLAKRLK